MSARIKRPGHPALTEKCCECQPAPCDPCEPAPPHPARLKIKLALFEEGLWCASFDGQETRTIPFTATSGQVANALNEVPAIRAAGGVTVYGSLLVSTTPAVDNSFFVTWN